MSLKIENDAQAQAARERLEAQKVFSEKVDALEKILNPQYEHGHCVSNSHGEVKAALSAYEAERELDKIALSEEELLRLTHKRWEEDGLFTHEAGKRLWDLGLMVNMHVTDRGRAYLARLEQKSHRPIQYEVHRVGVEYSFRAGFDNTGFIEAHDYAEYLTALNDNEYEVREVKA